MPLVSIREELVKARSAQYAVPLYDVFDIPAVEGVLEALEEKHAPTIVAVYAHFIEKPNAAAFAAYISQRFQSTRIPVSLMLDHGGSYEQCMQALSFGFTDVMFDGSALPVEENIAITRRVVQAAHARGAAVEAELGHVGWGSDYDNASRHGFTQPDQVERFVAETGVDFLAIAFGNAHGVYKGDPVLDLDLVREIRSRVDTPLAMHGGTGLSDEQFHGAIHAGIAKINIATLLANTAAHNMVEAARSEQNSIFTFAAAYQKAYRECALRIYDIFGTSAKSA
jgi:ketose-bisphosphate aldolase